MAESQSRYGIMEQLNNRKIKEKEKLTNIEKEGESYIYTTERTLELAKKEIVDKEGNYEMNHKDKIRELTVTLKMLEKDTKRQLDALQASIDEENKSYKEKFKTWKTEKQTTIDADAATLKRYKVLHNKKVTDKRAVIIEIESGIKDLKEVSKDQA